MLVLLFVFLFVKEKSRGGPGDASETAVKPLVRMKAEPASIVVVLVQGKWAVELS